MTALLDLMQCETVDDQTDALLSAADRVCDLHNDRRPARDAMRDDCLGTPLHLRADLLAHFLTVIRDD